MASDETTRHSIEALIFASPGPATAAQIRRALPRVTPGQVAAMVKEINEELARDGRPYEISEVAGGYRFRTRPEFGELILAGQPERKVRLSRPALETLSVIAYRQPVTRAEIEDLRCVDCGAVMKSLLDRQMIRIVGRRDAPGRPALYGTTSTFLESFGLKSLRDLPELREILAMEEEQGTPGPAGEETREDGDASLVHDAAEEALLADGTPDEEPGDDGLEEGALDEEALEAEPDEA